jgi:hypothetical protein
LVSVPCGALGASLDGLGALPDALGALTDALGALTDALGALLAAGLTPLGALDGDCPTGASVAGAEP